MSKSIKQQIPRWGFMIRVENESSGLFTGSKYFHITCFPVYYNEQGNLDFPGEYCGMGSLHRLKITCQADDQSPNASYAWKAFFGDDVNLGNIENVSKMLLGIKNKMTKYDSQDGYCDSFGRFCTRVARAAGASFFMKHKGGDVTNLEDYHYQIPVGDACQTINSILLTWLEKNNQNFIKQERQFA